MTSPFKNAIDDMQKALVDGVKKQYLADQLAALDQIANEQEPTQVARLEGLGIPAGEAKEHFLQAKKRAQEIVRKTADKLFG
jgi:hypothetical protein